ncbi:outer membrane beta-barrel protein [Paucibacter sp. APW11]|uniref:Outer membrane beta-barrel protein n=1 Tax=Roseateles aquae TaxID=3077235 RepID=A0ABU3PDJ3_9BURK|nr:outer membrane beta-barrel protein [Paucibacter sp. APW11]MDT9000668.1 outer membrane beta-barrel protein [Paucibacter sp. APW11]
MKKLMALAMAAALAAPAFAGDYYAGADIGRNRFSDADVSINRTGIALFGGYKLNETVAFEAGYRSLVNDDYRDKTSSVNIKLYALQLSAVFSAPVATDFAIYGRLGLNNIRGSISGTDEGDKFDLSGNRTKALFGFGGSYAFSKDVALRVEFQKPIKEVSVLSAGVQFNF